jgi:hypothetical protein
MAIKDKNYNIVGYAEGSTIKDRSYNIVGYAEGDNIKGAAAFLLLLH